jgi:hypothetical protein
MDKLTPQQQARAREIAAQAPPLTPEQRDLIARLFGRAVARIAENPPRVCRTMDEIVAAGARHGPDDPPLTQAQADLVAAILAPLRREQLRKALEAAELDER